MKYILLLTELKLFLTGFLRMKREKDIFNPFLIFSVPLIISLITNIAYFDQQYEIGEKTYFIYFISVIAFSMGLSFGVRANFTIRIKSIKNVSRFFYHFVWAFMIISLNFAIDQILTGFRSGIFGTKLINLIRNVRYYTQYVDEGNFFSIYGQVAADVLMLLQMYRYFVLRKKTEKKKMIIALMSYALFVATVFNRTAILYYVCTIAFLYSQKDRDYKEEKSSISIVILFVLVIGVFDFIAKNTGKATGTSGESWIIYYVGSQFYWLQQITLTVDFHTYGSVSLGIVGRLFYKLGILATDNLEKYRDLLRASGNPVSSFVAAPYLDFGFFGGVVLFFWGYFYGFIYKNHRRNGDIWTLFYATCIYPLVIAFYSFQFGLSNQLYVFLMLVIMGGRETVRQEKKKILLDLQSKCNRRELKLKRIP